MIKIVNISILLLSIISLLSCEDPGVVENSYPRRYKYESQSFGSINFFKIGNDDFEAITPNDRFLLVASDLEEETNIDTIGLLFKEFELIDESSVRVKLDLGDGTIIDTVLQYQYQGEDILIGSGTPTPFLFGGVNSTDEFELFYWTYYYSYFNSNLNQQKLSPVIIELSLATNDEPNQWIEQLILDGTLENSDTIGIQGFKVHYTLEN
ncbi:MAG: hypothetical protein DHS20C13_22300 [Thermodesulfobacteriota bacterium]|nr:MAG: hypothetical protein DHS20C13_22300 [Thermodesulfobacteriota bacterium]GJM35927.1 MAG: hypothetical protein DHS20C18_49280 [Saprospiraceae bacterium]